MSAEGKLSDQACNSAHVQQRIKIRWWEATIAGRKHVALNETELRDGLVAYPNAEWWPKRTAK